MPDRHPHVLLIGGGGREHALAWSLRRAPRLGRLYAAPGNPGIAQLAEIVPLDPLDCTATAGWARQNEIDLVLVGPEAPLAAGLADACIAQGVPVFGPTAAAALIESSKIYARSLMARAGVPQPRYQIFDDYEQARAHIDTEYREGCVVKADGLAAGKGALVCDDAAGAAAAARSLLVEKQLGAAGVRILVEERLSGEEASLFVITDGRNAIPLLPARDYKRLLEGDQGPNTGGMGSHAPAGRLGAGLLDQVMREIIRPTLAALSEDGAPFRGCLYAGLMLTEDGPRVIEFNCRFGDPETQAVLPLLESELLQLAMDAAHGVLVESPLEWSGQCSVSVTLASAGYPGPYAVGHPIRGLAQANGVPDGHLFQAGTRLTDEGIVTAGGRVMAAVGVGESFSAAAETAYEVAGLVEYEGKQLRRDIAARASEE